MDIDLGQLFEHLGLALAAFVLALPVAWERHAASRPAGLRTFPIVALASCAFVLLGTSAFPDDSGAQARIIQGLMTGIGFIGGGAILKDSGAERVRGIATAASIWTVGAIGAAAAYERFEIAIILSAANFAILRWLAPTVETVENQAAEAKAAGEKAMKKASDAGDGGDDDPD